MSFEGYEQKLCQNGHYWQNNVYDSYGSDEDPENCPICNAPVAWYNIVDLTNGCYCSCTCSLESNRCDQDCEHCGFKCDYCEKGRIDGYVELEIDKPAIYETCFCCGNKKLITHETYEIPTNKGHKIYDR